MKISEILKSREITVSYEVFPPKTDANRETVEKAAFEIASLKPDFMSVTYGAAGSTKGYTFDLALRIKYKYGVDTLAHLTCINSTKPQVKANLEELKSRGIDNILALRGDPPADGTVCVSDYDHASDLVCDIKQNGDFCIGGACYPEGHIDCERKSDDIGNLKIKVDAGAEFLTTQMFFDNNLLYNFLYRIREIGITVPVIAGIMPVTNKNQIKRICGLSGTYLPSRFKAIVDRFGDNPDAMKQAGIAYATEQIIDLIANGVNHIHIYSMNKPEIAREIERNLSNIIKR